MEFKIPFTFSNFDVLKKRSKAYRRYFKRESKKLQAYLSLSGIRVLSSEYRAICLRSFIWNFFSLLIVLNPILWYFAVPYFYLIALGGSMVISGFVYFNQLNYPKIYAFNKSRDIDRNIIPSLEDMLVQINSGVPLFSIMLNIANSDYGEVSKEFIKITNEINSGVPEIEAIEKYALLNISPYFKRVLWQISNGMRAGGQMEIVIRESINNLNEEQAIQIQNYGSKLNPLVMFYMIIAVILPSLGITFLVIISSLLSVSGDAIRGIMVMAAVFIIFIQIMFIGLIKSRRPRLL